MVSTERLFAPPSFEGLRVLRKRLLTTPDASLESIVAAVKLTEADSVSLDMEASVELHGMVAACALEGPDFYRHCIRGVVLARFPVWIKTIRLGRQVFAAKLEKDDFTIFENAGLLVSPPTPDVVEWWDTIGHEVKLETDLRKMSQARVAEKLSWDFEKARLTGLGIEKDPVWVGLDDNTAGYDILSYELGNPDIVNKLVEVKSSTSSPLRFFVTRNEWTQALRSRDVYFFHIWDMRKNPAILHVRTVAQVEPHIPTDNEKGKWTNADVPLGGS